jgi:nucleotide-binding universal stress UspA family protein
MKRFSNILLVATAGTDHSAALTRAATLAATNQARLTVCAVVDAIPAELQMAVTVVTPAELCDIAVTERRDWLNEIVKSVATDNMPVETKVLVGRAFVEIIRQVLGNDHDLVIKSAEGAVGLKDMLFGSTDMHLLRKCPCPVWIVKPTEHHQYRSVLADVDQDPEDAVTDALNRQILEMSSSLTLLESGELHVVHAWQLFAETVFAPARTGMSETEIDAMIKDEANERRRWLESLVDTYDVSNEDHAIDYRAPQVHLIKGDPKHVVPAKARELAVDLVVMGTVARTGIAGFFIGNTAESILNQLNCSVLTVKPPGFVSPVTLD